jgi:hypothetical protein
MFLGWVATMNPHLDENELGEKPLKYRQRIMIRCHQMIKLFLVALVVQIKMHSKFTTIRKERGEQQKR